MNLAQEEANLTDGLLRLQGQYSSFIHRLSSTHLVMDIHFYHEEIAMECAQAFLDAGITAVHRLDRPRVVSLQLPSLVAQAQTAKAIETLEAFLHRFGK
jgi:hypothetical protein